MLKGIGTFRAKTARYKTLCTNSEGYGTFCANTDRYGTFCVIGEGYVTFLTSPRREEPHIALKSREDTVKLECFSDLEVF